MLLDAAAAPASLAKDHNCAIQIGSITNTNTHADKDTQTDES